MNIVGADHKVNSPKASQDSLNNDVAGLVKSKIDPKYMLVKSARGYRLF